jgi:hypothetical protein
MKYYYLVDPYKELVWLRGKVTPEKVHELDNVVIDPPYSVVGFPEGGHLYDWPGHLHKGNEQSRPVRTIRRNSPMHFIADRDGCVWAKGQKDVLEMALAMLIMIQGTKAAES